MRRSSTASSHPERSAATEPSARRLQVLVAAVMAYWGYVTAVNPSVTPFLARDFALDDTRIAWALGWVALGSVGTLLLSRRVDRLGRRRAVLACMALLPVTALLTAVAPSLTAYVAAQVATHALAGTLLTVVVVIVAEEFPAERRAGGQALAGFSGSLGNGLPFLLVSFLAGAGGVWRWLWALAVPPILAFPLLRRTLTETDRWRQAHARGETRHARLADLFAGRYRRRGVGVVASALLLETGQVATMTWAFYHAARTLDLAAPVAAAVLLAGGLVGLAGFPLGGRLADSWGRRATFAVGTVLSRLAYVAYYTAVPSSSLVLVLSLACAAAAVSGNAAIVAYRSSVTELFPTRLRGTLHGCLSICTAVAAVVANFVAGALALWIGGLASAVVLLALVSCGAVVIFLALLPETAGLDLETAGLEDDGPPLAAGVD